MKNLILNGLFIVLICSLSTRLCRATAANDEYEEYNYDEEYDEYDENNEQQGIDEFAATTEIDDSAKSDVIVRNNAEVDSPPNLDGESLPKLDEDAPPKSDGNEEEKTESVRSVLVAETEVHQDDRCPRECICDEPLEFIDCTNRSLTEIPKSLPNTSLQIDLSNNEIQEIQGNDFSNLTVVRHILLKNNKIQKIDGNAFHSLDRLDSLDLSSNNLSKVDPNVFAHSQQLAVLTLDYNPISVEANQPFLNQPSLQILNMIGCNVTQLYNETFINLTELTSINLANNSFVENINVDAFNPLVSLLKLKIPLVSRPATYGLCEKISVIDVISFDSYNISCYELISGSTYDESTITEGPTVHLTSTTTPMPSSSTTQSPVVETTETTTNKARLSDKEIETTSPAVTESSTAKINAQNATSDEDVQSKKAGLSNHDMKTILIASIGIAILGLVIGLICRKDVFGVKTKLCRTKRREPSTIPEQVPLNKVPEQTLSKV